MRCVAAFALLVLVAAVGSAASPRLAAGATFEQSMSSSAVAAPDISRASRVGTLASAGDVTFGAGSLIIPMDIDFQNHGMLKAFGLVNKLLGAGIPVSWSVAPTKTLYTSGAVPPSSVDFTASATDVETGAAITSHGYRGGPFVIDAANRDAAMPIVTAWLTAHPTTVVHTASANFDAPVARILVNAPSIAVLATGNQDIIFGYLNSAAIPDGSGNGWTAASPGVLTPDNVAGPTTTNHSDGALFGATGQPAYSQLAAATWGASRDATTTEAVAEIAAFLTHRTHLFASGSAPIVVEDSIAGHFLTTDNGTGEPAATPVGCASATMPKNGLCVVNQPSAGVSFAHADLVFAQLDGQFGTIGGAAPAFGLAPGSTYFDSGVVIARDAAATADGVGDVWMTGYAGGSCQMASSRTETPACAAVGKVSYLGGHQYSTAIPVNANPTTQGTRLFLESLLEAGSIGAPVPPAPPAPPPPPPPLALDATKPLLSALSLSPTRFRAAAGGPSIAARVGATVSYRLSEPAAVRFTVERALPGRRVGGRCVKPKRSNRRAKRCTRHQTLRGAFTHRGKAGQNRFKFSGRLRARKLRPGRYHLRAVATDPAANKSRPKRSRFRIVRR